MSEYIFINNEWKKATKVHLDGIPIGFSLPFRAPQAPYGWLLEDGREISRITYAKLFSVIGTMYGEGDGETTFNLPNSIGKYTKFGIGEEVGTELEAGLPNITGVIDSINMSSLSNGTGAFSVQGGGTYILSSVAGAAHQWKNAAFDAKQSNSIYGNSDTVTPLSLVALPCIKAFDTIADEVKINLAAELEALKARYEAERMISTIIYPNGGSAGAEANVIPNQRIFMDNPFEGYFVRCEAQIKMYDKWGTPEWFDIHITDEWYWGVRANQLLPDDIIVVQTGGQGVGIAGRGCGAPFGEIPDTTTAPCRVIVHRMGKMHD